MTRPIIPINQNTQQNSRITKFTARIRSSHRSDRSERSRVFMLSKNRRARSFTALPMVPIFLYRKDFSLQ